MNYENAIKYWDEIDKNTSKLDNKELSKMIDEFIASHNTCALATGFGSEIRCTPIEYNYFDGYIYLISEGGHKFIGLRDNKNVALAIYDAYESFANCNGMQINGVAEIIEPDTKEYETILNKKHITLEALKKINHPMYLVKITPIEINYLSSKFKKMGLNTYRQKLIK